MTPKVTIGKKNRKCELSHELPNNLRETRKVQENLKTAWNYSPLPSLFCKMKTFLLKTFLLSQVKWSVINSNENGKRELSDQLPYDRKLTILITRKFQENNYLFLRKF